MPRKLFQNHQKAPSAPHTQEPQPAHGRPVPGRGPRVGQAQEPGGDGTGVLGVRASRNISVMDPFADERPAL